MCTDLGFWVFGEAKQHMFSSVFFLKILINALNLVLLFIFYFALIFQFEFYLIPYLLFLNCLIHFFLK